MPSPAVASFSAVVAFVMISPGYLHQRHILWTWFSKLRQARCTVSHLLSDGAERRPLGISQPDSNLSQDLNNLERRTGLSAQHLRKVHIAARRSCQGGDASMLGYLHWSCRAMRGHLCVIAPHKMVLGSSPRSTSCRWGIRVCSRW